MEDKRKENGQAAGQAPKQAPKQPAGQAPKQAPKQPAGQAPKQAPRQPVGQAPKQAPSHIANQAPKQAPSHAAGQAPKQAPSHAAGQAPKQAAPQAAGKKKGRKKWPIVVICVVAVLALLAGTAYAVFHHYFSLMGRIEPMATPAADASPSPTIEPEPEEEPAASPATEEEIVEIEDSLQKNLEQMEQDSDLYKTDTFNILLIGVDARDEAMSGRSDCMILASINKTTKKVVLTSFLRDIYLSIPGSWSDRLNAAYVYGGTDLLKETLKANFGITVDRCVVVNFYIVMDIVDAFGGIDLDLTADEIKVMNSYINNHNNLLGNPSGTDILSTSAAGTVHVDGNQALAYARVRYVGTDFARTGRQRTVITKCIEKAKTMDLGQISGLAEEFLPRVRTDLTEGDCATLLLMALDLGSYTFDQMVIPADGTWSNANIRGMAVLTVDFAANTQAWLDKVNGTDN